MKQEDETPYLHIYQQSFSHDFAYIAGNRKGLESLRDRIEQTLLSNYGRCEAFDGGGEGYYVDIVLASPDAISKVCTPWDEHDARPGPERLIP